MANISTLFELASGQLIRHSCPAECNKIFDHMDHNLIVTYRIKKTNLHVEFQIIMKDIAKAIDNGKCIKIKSSIRKYDKSMIYQYHDDIKLRERFSDRFKEKFTYYLGKKYIEWYTESNN
jgi:hypothetical protein